MDSPTQFIRDSILDIQATIRALDSKVGILLVILLAPLSSLGKISSHAANYLDKYSEMYSYLLVGLFFSCWLISMISILRALNIINDPAKYIDSNGCKGSFYSGGLYEFEIIDVFMNRGTLNNTIDVNGQMLVLPQDEDAVKKELVFEQIKLVYIRDIKILRLKFGQYAAYVWLISGLVIYFFSRFTQ